MTGNHTTALMHLLAWTELHRLRVTQTWSITKIRAEQTVILHPTSHDQREGKFDFYAETPTKTIGFEVLTRPSKGKLLKKFIYRPEVDEFVFILPNDALSKYRRKERFGRRVQSHFLLPSQFGERGLFVWLIDLQDRRIVAKEPFFKIYNVDPNGHAPKKGKKSRRRRT
ncbi:MAG: hypothetical protein U1C71_03510 [archaeon]|nr:hypothetical protein [archaeon]